MNKPQKRKLNKKELAAVSRLIKDGMKVTAKEIIEAIEQNPHCELYADYFMSVHGEEIADAAFAPKQQDNELMVNFQARQELYDKSKHVIYAIFALGLKTGMRIDETLPLDLAVLKQVKEETK